MALALREWTGISLDDYDGYLAGHIPGAVFAGMIADLSDPDHPLPDMLAPPGQFARVMCRLGIAGDTLVVAYDNMGFPLVRRASGGPCPATAMIGCACSTGACGSGKRSDAMSTDIPLIEPASFTPRIRREWIAAKENILAAIGRSGTVIVNCLTPELYRGGERHLWGQRPGHIPGARNVPYLANIDPVLDSVTATERERLLASGRSFTFAARDTLAGLYRNAGVTPDREVITYCGRGYAGACGLLALKLLGYERARLYDGSWASRRRPGFGGQGRLRVARCFHPRFSLLVLTKIHPSPGPTSTPSGFMFAASPEVAPAAVNGQKRPKTKKPEWD